MSSSHAVWLRRRREWAEGRRMKILWAATQSSPKYHPFEYKPMRNTLILIGIMTKLALVRLFCMPRIQIVELQMRGIMRDLP